MRQEWTSLYCDKNYVISNHGEVFSVKSRKYLKMATRTDGYPAFTICSKCKPQTLVLHRAVALSFGIIEPEDHVNHKDGNKRNPRLDNLEKSNPLHNMKHAKENGLLAPRRGQDSPNAKITDAKARRIKRARFLKGMSIKEIAKKFDMKIGAVTYVIYNGWKHIDL
jgi:hypothetical protein